jgi:hypothetical protein
MILGEKIEQSDSAIARPRLIAPYLNLAFKPSVPNDGTQYGHC